MLYIKWVSMGIISKKTKRGYDCNDYEKSDECGNSKECDDLSFVNDIDVNIPPYEDLEVGSIRISRPDRNRPFFCTPTVPISCDSAYLN
ncbi:hypothetical protein F8M41_008287 [Gigaspora margarita]|uniref:Uncharacterized protein n=1 Tax=Gigaspora margarita TaxID=4874 RepID=A0A8H3X5I4_GIGMA|nr:hypothetical protein F8M41_008287 [Gigaspora margarita]